MKRVVSYVEWQTNFSRNHLLFFCDPSQLQPIGKSIYNHPTFAAWTVSSSWAFYTKKTTISPTSYNASASANPLTKTSNGVVINKHNFKTLTSTKQLSFLQPIESVTRSTMMSWRVYYMTTCCMFSTLKT